MCEWRHLLLRDDFPQVEQFCAMCDAVAGWKLVSQQEEVIHCSVSSESLWCSRRPSQAARLLSPNPPCCSPACPGKFVFLQLFCKWNLNKIWCPVVGFSLLSQTLRHKSALKWNVCFLKINEIIVFSLVQLFHKGQFLPSFTLALFMLMPGEEFCHSSVD